MPAGWQVHGTTQVCLERNKRRPDQDKKTCMQTKKEYLESKETPAYFCRREVARKSPRHLFTNYIQQEGSQKALMVPRGGLAGPKKEQAPRRPKNIIK